MQYGALSKQVAAAVLKTYSQLGPRGKPGRNGSGKSEWNVLAGFALCSPQPTLGDYSVECLSLGTGLKVMPNASYRTRGDGLHDSHAEVVARRSLLRWFYSQLELAVAGKVCHLERGELCDATEGTRGVGGDDARRWRLKKGLLLGMYISTLPCGDASMYHLSLQPQNATAVPSTSPPAPVPATTATTAKNDAPPEVMVQNARLARELGLTTTYERDAPSTSTTNQQHVQRGRQGYNLSSLRTKPGRPDSRLATSHSCSDKISLWNYVGVQGGLLSHLLERVSIDVMAIGLVVKEEERERMTAEVRRGLGGRLESVDASILEGESTAVEQEYCLKLPEIYFSDVEFFHAKEVVLRRCGALGNESDIVSGLSSLSFVAGEGVEMINTGAKQGVSMKKYSDALFPEMYISRLSKLAMMRRYRSIAEPTNSDLVSNQSYHDLKHLTSPSASERSTVSSTPKRRSYQEAKDVIRGKSGPFSGWLVTGKPFENFDVDGNALE